jgi:hypothetical protein
VRRSIRRIGLPVPTWASPFPADRWFSLDAGRCSVAREASSSRELYLLFRVRGCLSPARHCCQLRAPSLGSCSSSRYQPVESTNRRASHARLTFRPQRFSHSRRFAPPLAFAGLFHPTTTSRIRSSGVFPAPQPARLIDASCPHAVFRRAPATELPPWLQLSPARLQGFDPGSDPLRPTGGLDLPSARSPLGLSLPRAFLRTPW